MWRDFYEIYTLVKKNSMRACKIVSICHVPATDTRVLLYKHNIDSSPNFVHTAEWYCDIQLTSSFIFTVFLDHTTEFHIFVFKLQYYYWVILYFVRNFWQKKEENSFSRKLKTNKSTSELEENKKSIKIINRLKF